MTAQVKCSESPAPRKAFCLRLGSRKNVFALITASHVHPGSPPPSNTCLHHPSLHAGPPHETDNIGSPVRRRDLRMNDA